MPEFDRELDACGLNCPLPILRAKKTLGKMSSGEVLRIVATDPGSVRDFEAFSKHTGNPLLDSREEEGKFFFLLRKG
jgi:tRNA 2-thiouridine synthesizing protein A